MILFQNEIVRRNEGQVDIEDRGYQFGDGVYEVIRVYETKPFVLEAHFARLCRSANEIGITVPYSNRELEEKVTQLIALNELNDGHVYMQLTRGVAPRDHRFPDRIEPVLIAYTKEYAKNKGNKKELEADKAITTDDIRWLRCDIKSLNLLGNVLAKQAATEKGCAEAILHRDGVVTEGSSTNVFIIKNDVLQTHPANTLILNGITRMIVLELAEEIGLSVVEEAFTVAQLREADEVFITATTFEIKAIVQVDEKRISDGLVGYMTEKLFEAFQKRIKKANV